MVLAFLIAIFGTLAGLRDAGRYFSQYQYSRRQRRVDYNGLLPNDMSGRVIYYYERYITSQVGDIEHSNRSR